MSECREDCMEGLRINENVEKVVEEIVDLLSERIDKLKCKISDVCRDNEEIETKLCRVDNWPNYVEVHSTGTGYKIISYMPSRGIITSEYLNSEKYNNKSKWDLDLIIEHGQAEEEGLISPTKKY